MVAILEIKKTISHNTVNKIEPENIVNKKQLFIQALLYNTCLTYNVHSFDISEKYINNESVINIKVTFYNSNLYNYYTFKNINDEV